TGTSPSKRLRHTRISLQRATLFTGLWGSEVGTQPDRHFAVPRRFLKTSHPLHALAQAIRGRADRAAVALVRFDTNHLLKMVRGTGVLALFEIDETQRNMTLEFVFPAPHRGTRRRLPFPFVQAEHHAVMTLRAGQVADEVLIGNG